MKWSIPCLILLATSCTSSLQVPLDPLAPIRFTLGTWQGTTNDDKQVTSTFDEVFGKQFIRWQERITAVSGDRTRAEQTIGFFHFDTSQNALMLRRYESDGQVTDYALHNHQDRQLEWITSEKKILSMTLETDGGLTIARNAETQDLIAQKPENWLKGIDVSHFSGSVDWQTLAREEIAFAFLKATEGEDWTDPTFTDHMQALKGTDILRGAYHFFVLHDDPVTQANHFIETVSLSSGDLIPVIDIETMGDQKVDDPVSRLKTWLDMVEQHFGVKPMIYTSHRFWNNTMNTAFADYPLWIAEYEVDLPTLPEGWERWTYWQYKGDASVPGITKTADLSYFNGKAKALKALTLP